jgi:hypothetical protein
MNAQITSKIERTERHITITTTATHHLMSEYAHPENEYYRPFNAITRSIALSEYDESWDLSPEEIQRESEQKLAEITNRWLSFVENSETTFLSEGVKIVFTQTESGVKNVVHNQPFGDCGIQISKCRGMGQEFFRNWTTGKRPAAKVAEVVEFALPFGFVPKTPTVATPTVATPTVATPTVAVATTINHFCPEALAIAH